MNAQNVVSLRFKPDEVASLRAAAEREHSTISEYIRGVCGRAALADLLGARTLRTSSGAPLVVWSNCPDAFGLPVQ